MEVWKDVIGYEELYQVSDLGRVKRKLGYQSKQERILKHIDNGTGYKCVCLSKHSKIKRIYVHRLVALNFLTNTEKKEEVNHIDGKKDNNKLTNLEWVTRSENHYHRYKVLNQRGVNYGKTGDKNWRSKPVKKLDLNNNVIKIYPAVMEAMRQTGINESSIRACIYGKQKTAGGYKWTYC
jgi:hypothetical protein